MDQRVDKISFLGHGMLLWLVCAKTLSSWVCCIFLLPWFLRCTELMWLDLFCHRAGDDPFRTFRNKKSAHINQCLLTFPSLYFWHQKFCSNLSFSYTYPEQSSHFPGVFPSFHMAFSVASSCCSFPSYITLIGFERVHMMY